MSPSIHVRTPLRSATSVFELQITFSFPFGVLALNEAMRGVPFAFLEGHVKTKETKPCAAVKNWYLASFADTLWKPTVNLDQVLSSFFCEQR